MRPQERKSAAEAPGYAEQQPDLLAGSESLDVSKFTLRLSKPHRLIQKTLPSPGTCDHYGHPVRNDMTGVDVRVSKAMFKPALVVMDLFIKALEARELQVRIVQEYQVRGTYACAADDRIQIFIQEQYKRAPHIPTANELREKEKHSWNTIPKWDNVPTGKLVLTPGGVVDLSSDTAISKLIETAVAETINKLEVARKKRIESEAVRKLEFRRQMEQADEKLRVDAFFKAAESLRQYHMLMSYIEEVRRFGRVPPEQLMEGQTVEEWLCWAEARAQRCHPLGS